MTNKYIQARSEIKTMAANMNTEIMAAKAAAEAEGKKLLIMASCLSQDKSRSVALYNLFSIAKNIGIENICEDYDPRDQERVESSSLTENRFGLEYFYAVEYLGLKPKFIGIEMLEDDEPAEVYEYVFKETTKHMSLGLRAHNQDTVFYTGINYGAALLKSPLLDGYKPLLFMINYDRLKEANTPGMEKLIRSDERIRHITTPDISELSSWQILELATDKMETLKVAARAMQQERLDDLPPQLGTGRNL